MNWKMVEKCQVKYHDTKLCISPSVFIEKGIKSIYSFILRNSKLSSIGSKISCIGPTI